MPWTYIISDLKSEEKELEFFILQNFHFVLSNADKLDIDKLKQVRTKLSNLKSK